MTPNSQLSDALYRRVGEELLQGERSPGATARAIAECNGNSALVEGLYIKFRVQELMNEVQLIVEREKREQKDKGLLVCPYCGHCAKPLRKARGDCGVLFVLLLLFVVPGIIYLIARDGYEGVCAKCGRTLLPRL